MRRKGVQEEATAYSDIIDQMVNRMPSLLIGQRADVYFHTREAKSSWLHNFITPFRMLRVIYA